MVKLQNTVDYILTPHKLNAKITKRGNFSVHFFFSIIRTCKFKVEAIDLR